MEVISEDPVDPRVLRTRRVVLDAVLAELAQAGYGRFAIEAVAVRAGVGKSTIYRHWKGKVDLIADALDTLNTQPEVESVGSHREQVEALLTHFAQGMIDSRLGACVPALIEASERDERVRDLYRRYSTPRRQSLRDPIAKGISTAEFPAHIDADLAAQALAGAVVYRRLMTDEPLTPGEVPDLVTTVLGPG